MTLSIPKDAFSDGQVRSKLWLVDRLNEWATKWLIEELDFSVTWYGSWVGVGPFLLLSKTNLKIFEIKLLEIDNESLKTSELLLNHWQCQGLAIHMINADMNHYIPHISKKDALFVNTSCEHVEERDWLKNIPQGAYLLLQTTNMEHAEHINLSSDLQSFKDKVNPYIEILESDEISFSYPDKSFNRFMILGKRC